MSIFEKASRVALRFDTPKGLLTVEDLWDLPLKSTVGRPNLDDIARDLHGRLKSDDNVSFVDDAHIPDESQQLAFEIVKHVIAVKKEERRIASEKEERAAKKQRILEIMAKKQDEHLSSKSLEELQAELATL